MGKQESTEGFVAVPGGHVWYRKVGWGDLTPILVLHGGPGYPHDYLEPLEELAIDRSVVFYDQLGCGRSERPDDPGLWTVERAVLELAAVREALSLPRVHLYGHSWGTMLAVDYALTWPEGLESLILASPCIQIPRWIEDSKQLRKQLPTEVQQVLDHGEATGEIYSPEYLNAYTLLKQLVGLRSGIPATMAVKQYGLFGAMLLMVAINTIAGALLLHVVALFHRFPNT